jgi:hypothetical protein
MSHGALNGFLKRFDSGHRSIISQVILDALEMARRGKLGESKSELVQVFQGASSLLNAIAPSL